MKAYTTYTEAKEAIRQELRHETGRTRPFVEFKHCGGQCGCGDTSGIFGVAFNRTGDVIGMGRPVAICKKCG